MPIININVPVNKKVYSVSEINRQSKNLLEAKFSNIQIEGEISNLSKPASGHFYFKLKDSNAQIQCAFFRNRAMKLRFKLEEGMHIIANANVSMYEARGDYQLIIEHVELAGVGQLQLKFEALKQKLLTQGLFSVEHKKTLPSLPKSIGIITSPTGAALQDALTTLKRQCPMIPIYIYPTQVQGNLAAPQIAKQIEFANTYKQCEVLLLIRGGGSLEDLWPFNEECVAQAIYSSELPIISGVGHETDITLADYCADKRAATPTAAAGMVSPHQDELKQYITLQKNLLIKLTNQLVEKHKQTTLHLTQRLRNPNHLINQRILHTNALTNRLNQSIHLLLHNKHKQLQSLLQMLQKHNPSSVLQTQQLKVLTLQHRLIQAIEQKHSKYQQQFKTLCTLLHATSPLATIDRGYSLSYQEDHTLISSINQLKEKDTFWVQVKDGKLHAKLLNKQMIKNV